MSDKIQRFDRPTAAKFGTDLHELTSNWAQAQGVELQRRSAVFNPEANTYKVTLTFHIAGTPDGLELNYKLYAKQFGLEPEDLGAIFAGPGGHVYKIVGLDLKARKRPIIAEWINETRRPGEPAKRYKFTIDFVKKTMLTKKDREIAREGRVGLYDGETISFFKPTAKE